MTLQKSVVFLLAVSSIGRAVPGELPISSFPPALAFKDANPTAGAGIDTMNALPSALAATDTACKISLYDSEVATVIAASEMYNPLSIAEDREYMGAILQCGQGYYYTAAPGVAGQDQITVRVSVPAGSHIVAFWHTHGAAALDRQYFSEVDTALALSWNKPFYLADYTGALKVFAPGDKLMSLRKASRLGLPARNGFSRGRLVHDHKGRLIRVATSIKQRFFANNKHREDDLPHNIEFAHM